MGWNEIMTEDIKSDKGKNKNSINKDNNGNDKNKGGKKNIHINIVCCIIM